MRYSEKPNERTIRRACKEPRKSMSMSLYAAAAKKKQSMEQLLKLPLYFCGQRIDGYVLYFDTIYAFSADMPVIPPPRSLYVFHVKDAAGERDVIGAHRGVRKYEYIRGICVFEIRLLPNKDYSPPTHGIPKPDDPYEVKQWSDKTSDAES